MQIQHTMIGDHPIHPVGIGTWLVGGGPDDTGNIVADTKNDGKALEALRYSLSLGQNHIDTAQVFGNGHTDELIGRAIKGFSRKDLFISSKVWKTHLARDKVREAVDVILKRLGVDYLDMLSIHKPWPEVPLEETLKGINDAVDEGTVRYVGVNNLSLEQLERAVAVSTHPIRAIQLHYSLWAREDAPRRLRSYCKDNGILLVAFKPLERGKQLAAPSSKILVSLSEKYGRSVSQIALNWLIRQDGCVAIPKSLNPEHIKSNVEAAEFALSEEDWSILTESSEPETSS